MRLIFRILSFLILAAMAWVLIQNVNYLVDVDFFQNHFIQVPLPFILISASTAGFLIGALLMSVVAFRYKSEQLKANKKIKNLMKELDSLRNLSIEEINLNDLDIDQLKPNSNLNSSLAANDSSLKEDP